MSANSKLSAKPGPAAECHLAHTLFPIADRRASPRIRTVCFDVRLNRGGYVGLYRARNISDAGMLLNTHTKFDADERLLIELSEPFAIEGTVLWSDGARCGIRFEQPIDCAALLHAQAARKREDRRGGALRLAAMRRATVYAENGIRAVKVINASYRGMGLTHDGTLSTGMMLKVIVESGIARDAAVRWSSGGRAGIRLMEPLTCEELERVSGFNHLAEETASPSAFFGGIPDGEHSDAEYPVARQRDLFA
jgi:hypothetical protein